MRTKPIEGVLRLDITRLDPHPELYLCYDGLAGITQRLILRDIMDELWRKGPEVLQSFVAAVKQHSPANVQIYFADYVSYGVGGGDAVAEYYYRTMIIWYEPARAATKTEVAIPEHLALRRNPPIVPADDLPIREQQVERLALVA